MFRTTYTELDIRFVPVLLLDRALLTGGLATLTLLPRDEFDMHNNYVTADSLGFNFLSNISIDPEVYMSMWQHLK